MSSPGTYPIPSTWFSRKRVFTRAVLGPVGLSLLLKTEICKSTGHENSQPTRPERNAQATNLCLPAKDDPQKMDDRHHEKQRRSDRHIGFLIQSACLSASHAQHDDRITATSCST